MDEPGKWPEKLRKEKAGPLGEKNTKALLEAGASCSCQYESQYICWSPVRLQFGYKCTKSSKATRQWAWERELTNTDSSNTDTRPRAAVRVRLGKEG